MSSLIVDYAKYIGERGVEYHIKENYQKNEKEKHKILYH